MLEHYLETAIAREAPEGDVALLLSGGVDSLSCGAAAQALGKRVHAYTFQLLGEPSADSLSAARAASRLGWAYTLIDVPTCFLEQDFLTLARRWHCTTKTQFECTFPFLYVIPSIRERVVLSGICADGHYGLSRKAMQHWRTPKARFDQFRATYFAQANPAGLVQLRALCVAYGRTLVAPYLDLALSAYLRTFDWDTLNRPHQKMPALSAYPDVFRLVGRRPHQNLQLVAGIDTLFTSLLKASLNTRRRTRVLDLCRDLALASRRYDELDGA
jgi:asparagine synthetase B (glutamine-hydrolysing)